MKDTAPANDNAEDRAFEADLVALLGSRICHDLVSPLGAVGNGLELMEMTGSTSGEEMALTRDSLDAALARIAFFRIAFGRAAADLIVPAREMRELVGKMYRTTRIKALWRDAEDRSRPEMRLAALALLCVETAVPWGGTVEVTRNPNAWVLHVDAERLKIDAPLWQALGRGEVPRDLAGSEVQFGILGRACRALRRPISISADERHLSLLV
jgi:histidine phosphotransferase ChpT